MTNTQYTSADAVGSSIALTQAVRFATHFIAACARSTGATALFFINSVASKPLESLGGTPC